MCEAKLMDGKISIEIMTMLDVTSSIEMAANTNALWWLELVLRAEKDNPLRMTLSFEVRELKKKALKKHMERKNKGENW